MAFLNNAGVERLWAHILSRLNRKVDKVEGKGLSTEDFTTEEKEKLAALGEDVQADWKQTDETQKDFIKNKPDVATDDDIIDLMLDMDMMPVVQDADGTILVDSDNTIILI